MLEDKKNDSFCIWKWFPLPKQYPSAMNDGKKMRWIHHNFSLKDLTNYGPYNLNMVIDQMLSRLSITLTQF